MIQSEAEKSLLLCLALNSTQDESRKLIKPTFLPPVLELCDERHFKYFL